MMRIYLDQCACSALVRDPAWRELRELLVSFSSDGVIACPIPYETIQEASQCEPATRGEIFLLFHQISQGLLWKSFCDHLIDNFLWLVRGGEIPHPFRFVRDFAALSEISGEGRESFHDLKQERNQDLAALTPTPGANSMSHEDIVESVEFEVKSKLCRDLKQIAFGASLEAVTTFECARISVELLERGVTAEEASSLAEAIEAGKFSTIPVQFFHARLVAQGEWARARDDRRGPPDYNDLIDQERLSLALAWVELAITDRRMAERVRGAALEQFTPCLTFAMGEIDGFISTLKERLMARQNGNTSGI